MKLLKICEWTSSIRFALSEQDLFDWCSATFQKRKAAQIRYDLEFRVYIQGPSKKRNETNHQTIHSGRLKKNLAELLSHTLDYQERGVSKAISLHQIQLCSLKSTLQDTSHSYHTVPGAFITSVDST